MEKPIRCNLYFPPRVVDVVDAVANERGISRTAAFVRAVGLMQAFEDAARDGLHIGISADRTKFDTILVTAP